MEKEQLNQIVIRAQKGDEEAQSELYLGCRDDLYYYILKTVNDSHLAEDLLQDTFMEILQTLDKLEAPQAYVTWSRQIAYHRCTAYFRKRHDLLVDEDEDGYSVFETVEEEREEFIPDAALDKEDLKQTIGQMINDLPEVQRNALLLRYFDELPVEEIAKIQGVSEGTVKSRLNYGRKAIKSAVEDYEKKNGIKLHTVAILPLLLWFFREKAIAEGVSLTAKGAAAAGTSAAAAAPAAASAAPVAAAVKTAAVTGAKVAAKGLVTKIIAGSLAAVVLLGVGVGVAWKLGQKDQSYVDTTEETEDAEATKPEATQPEATQPDAPEATQPDDPQVLPGFPEAGTLFRGYGYFIPDGNGMVGGGWLEIIVEKMDETEITGQITTKHGGKVYDQVKFTGTFYYADGPKVVYNVSMSGVEGWNGDEKFMLQYNRQTDQMQHFCNGDTLMYNDTTFVGTELNSGVWTGPVEDRYSYNWREGQQMQIVVDRMTDKEISGEITVTLAGFLEYETKFTGLRLVRNFDETYTYELLLETERVSEIPHEPMIMDHMYIVYHPEDESLALLLQCNVAYLGTLQKGGEGHSAEPVELPGNFFYGLGEITGFSSKHWFDITVENISTKSMTGKLKVGMGNWVDTETDFLGTDGVQNGNKITYQCSFDFKASILGDSEVTLTYDLENHTFTLVSSSYNVVIYCDAALEKIPLEVGTWTGMGTYKGYNINRETTLAITGMNSKAVDGNICITYQGETELYSTFQGRGIRLEDGTYFFDIILDEIWHIPGIGGMMDTNCEALQFIYDPADSSVTMVGFLTGDLTKN